MSDSERLADRLAAVERAVSDGETDLAALAEGADLAGRIEAVEGRLADVEEQIADLEAATEALRGYVGNVRAVNGEVERRADAALDKATEVERALESGRVRTPVPGARSPPVDPTVCDGWRDATGCGSPEQEPEVDDPGGDGGDASDLRATVRRLREAL